MINLDSSKLAAFKNFALALGKLSHCKKREVGCIIFPHDYHQIFSIGYNGPPAGLPNDMCTMLDFCGCIHAEANALLKLNEVHDKAVLLCTLAPCVRCAGLIINSRRIDTVLYTAHNSLEGINLLKKANINVHYV